MIKFYNRDLFRFNTEPFLSEDGTKIGNVTTFRTIPFGEDGGYKVVNKCFATDNFQKQNIRIWSHLYNGKPIVKINASDENKFDTDVYMIAIPFNGIIKPIEKSFDFRIFRAFIANSDRRNIEFDGEFYKSIAYMIVVPNIQLLNEDHKYSKESLVFNFSFVTRSSDRDGETRSEETTVSLTFTKEGLVSVKEVNDVPNDYADDFTKRGPLFPIYKPEEKSKKESKPKKSIEPENKNSKNVAEERRKKMLDKFEQPKTPYVKKKKPNTSPKNPVNFGDPKLEVMIAEMNRKFSCEYPKSDKRSKRRRK